MVGAIVYSYIFYIAFFIFVVGFIYRVIRWANIPVPLNIVTTGRGYLDNPQSRVASALRMASEVLLFRTLWRNTEYDLATNDIKSNRWLWLGAISFHFFFLLTIIRQLRLIIEPVPSWMASLRAIDLVGVLMPGLNYSGLLIIVALLYLLIRRWINPELKYISILSDYFVLLLILAIAISGNVIAYYTRMDVTAVKAFMLSLFAFKPMAIASDFHWFFFVHFFLVCVLIAYFPFSKLMHAPGIFFSPTRNQVNNPRTKRHINPWDYPVEVESWSDYRERFESGPNPQGVLKDVEE